MNKEAFKRMRNKLWRWFARNHPEATILSGRLLIIRSILYPVDTLYWRHSVLTGYQWDRDIWIIEGVKYSGAALRMFAESEGEIYRIKRTGSVLTVEQLYDEAKPALREYTDTLSKKKDDLRALNKKLKSL